MRKLIFILFAIIGLYSCSNQKSLSNTKITEEQLSNQDSLILKSSDYEPIRHNGHAAHASHMSHYSSSLYQ